MHFDIYYDYRTKIKLRSTDNVDFTIQKVFNVDSKVIFLNSKNQLFLANKTNDDFLDLKKIWKKDGIIDIDFNYPMFYLVDIEGHVYKTILEQITEEENYQKIEFFGDEKITSVVANNDGVLFITKKTNELMGMGNFGNVLKSDDPKKIECFKNMQILQIAKGDNFVVVLVQHNFLSIRENFIEEYTTRDLPKEELIHSVLKRGKSVLKTEVWSFGSINRGHLGIGDHIKRIESNLIFGIANQSVYKIFCGCNHALALTLDGRLFLWGDNSQNQISLDSNVSDFSVPTEFRVNNNAIRGILDACAGNNNTVILLNNLNFKILKKPTLNESDDNENLKADDSFENNLKYECENQENLNSRQIPFVLSHGKILVVNRKNISLFLLNYFTEEQKMATTLTEIYHRYIKKIMKHYEEAQPLIESFEIIFNIVLVNLKMCFEYMENNKEHQLEDIFVNRNFDFVMTEFTNYLRNLCDFKCFWTYDRFSNLFERKSVKTAFEKVFSCLQIYEKLFELIYDLRLYENNQESMDIQDLKLQIIQKKKVINDFLKMEVPNQLKEADETYRFWSLLNESHVKHELHKKERRFILDSQQISLKLLERSSLFSTNRFILFNDYLVCCLSRIEYIPINLVWVSAFNINGKNSFKIITPENQYKVYSLTTHDKAEWQSKLRSNIWNSLELAPTNNINLPSSRFGSYKFHEKNSKYANFEVIQGKWLEGKFYDLCEIKIPPNRLFKCRINRPGELSGFGIVKEDEIHYEGEFVNGKIQGYGNWENKLTGTTYSGYFKQDKCHGFGHLVENEGLYVGSFVNGTRAGYGVYDETMSGNKYMGTYSDSKRHGTGIYITMEGTYFEGTFVNNVLSGEGLAIFPSGIYYIGELSVTGPTGNGMMYMPDSEIIEEIIELDDSKLKMKGTILKGNLSGTWDDVTINSGQMQLNQIFLKTPSSNVSKISPEKKCTALFDCWTESLFGSSNLEMLSSKLTIHERWHFVVVNMTRKHRFIIDLSDSFQLKTMKYDLSACEKSLNSSFASSNSTSFNRSNSETNLKDYNNTLISDMDTSSLKSFNDLSLSQITDDDTLNSSVLSIKSTTNRELNFIPKFISSDLTSSQLVELTNYLRESLENDIHPFYELIKNIRNSFILSYGNWKCKPTSILSNAAMQEWNAIVRKVYSILRFLFPGLPAIEPNGNSNICQIDQDSVESQIISPLNFLHPILLNDDIYSSLFLLYASKSSKQDEIYRLRVVSCSKKSPEELRNFLKIDSDLVPILESPEFNLAVKTFKQITEKYCPSEMLNIIKQTYALIDESAKKPTRKDILNADNLLAISIYLLIKANIPHLGAELALLEDLMELDMEKLINSHCGYCYTTIKISYLHIVSGQFFQN